MTTLFHDNYNVELRRKSVVIWLFNIDGVLSQGQITTLFPEVYMETGKMCGFLIV